MKMKFLFCLILLFSKAHGARSYLEWFPSAEKVKTGQTLVIHGLNTKPEKMSDIIAAANDRGSDVLLLKLLGHNQDLKEFKKVSVEKWQAQVHEAFDQINAKNEVTGGKITLIGYSLGALMGAAFLTQNLNYHVDRMILFAPALRVKFTSSMIQLLFPLGGNVMIPSLTPKSYRAQEGTSIAAYKALFLGERELRKGSLEILNVPTTVFIDKKDELVSYEKIKDFAKDFSNWELVEVKKEKGVEPYHHLIIGPSSLGPSEWKQKILPKFDAAYLD